MKNKFMRIAAVMLMLCLVTTCAISGTFAKYTTEASGSDTARVAYWGFTGEDADIAIGDLFATSYAKDTSTYDKDNTVVSANTDKVIAPGTTNSATFIFEYTPKTGTATAPEVAYTLTVNASESTIADAIKNNNNIKWAVCKTADVTGGVIPTGEWGTWDAMINEINGLDGDETFDAGELAPIANTSYTIAWDWAISGTDGDTEDTTLGNTVADLDVLVKITINATQID